MPKPLAELLLLRQHPVSQQRLIFVGATVSQVKILILGRSLPIFNRQLLGEGEGGGAAPLRVCVWAIEGEGAARGDEIKTPPCS